MKTKKKAPIIRIKGFDGDWEQRKVSELENETYGGGTPKTSIEEYWNGNIPWIQSSDIIEHDVNSINPKKFISEEAVNKSATKLVPENSIAIVTRVGVGKLVIMPFSYATSQDFLSLSKLNSDTPFTAYLLYKKMQNESHAVQGTSIKGITKEELLSKEVMIPQLKEQKIIGTYFQSLDHLITLHQREIDRIVCLRKAMVEKMFPQNGADVPAVRFSRYKEPWRLCQFSEIFTERHIIDTISDEYPQLAFTIEEGVIMPEDKKTNKRDFLIIDKATKKYLQTEYDDIIYNPANVIYGAIHRNALGKGCVSPIYKIFYTDQDSTFMECIVRHPNFIKEISRSMEGTVKKLRTLKPTAFLEMSAYIAPTIEEQRQIGEYFRQMDRLIEIEKEELEKIKHIKSACLEKMFV